MQAIQDNRSTTPGLEIFRERGTAQLAALLFVVCLLIHPSPGGCQSLYGTIVGSVTDAGGAAVQGATVTATLLATNDYIGEATFGGSPMSPETVASLNRNIHLGLLVVLVIAICKFLWDTAQWLRPGAIPSAANKTGASS